jgi:hypothetical protein
VIKTASKQGKEALAFFIHRAGGVEIVWKTYEMRVEDIH